MKDLLPEQQLGTKLVTKGFWLYFFSFIILPLGYISRTIVSNTLPVADVGLLYAVIGLMTLLAGYNDLGLTGVLKYFLPKYRVEKKYRNISSLVYLTYILQISTGLIMAAIFYFGAERLGEWYFHHEKAAAILKIFSIYFLFFNAFQIITGVASAFQNTFLEKFTHFVQVAVTSLCAIGIFFFFPHTAEHFARIRVIGLISAVIIGGILYARNFSSLFVHKDIYFEKGELKKIFHFAGILFLTINISMLLGQADLQMVTYMMGPTYAGYFTNYRILLVIANTLIIPLSTLLFPMVSELFTKKDMPQVNKLVALMYTYVPITVMALGFFFIALGPEIAVALFGVQFTYSGILLQISGGFLFLRALTSINFAILAGIGQVKTRLRIIAVALGINIVGNYIGIVLIDLPGAVIATVISWTIVTILSTQALKKYIHITWPKSLYIKNILFFSALTGCIFLVKSQVFFIESNSYRYQNMLLLGVFFVIYALLIFLYNKNTLLPLITEVRRIIKK